jgi:hypothetical protein
MFASLLRCILLSLVVLSAAACIRIPYKPGSTVSKGDFIETLPTQSVRYVEGEVVTTLAKKIQSMDKGITVVAHRDLEAVASWTALFVWHWSGAGKPVRVTPLLRFFRR